MSQTNLPLPQYYAQTLRALLPIFDDSLPLSEASTQAKLQECLTDLYLISRMLASLGIFSSNEDVDELSEKELVFMSVPYILGESESKTGLGGYDARQASLKRSETALNQFQALLETYKVVNKSGAAGVPSDPGQRRDAKIAAYKRDKEVRETIASSLPGQLDASSPVIAFILALLPQESSSSTSVNDDEDSRREVTLNILKLLYSLSETSLSNTAMELSLLANAPKEAIQGPLDDPRAKREENEDAQWRLDRTPGSAVKPKELISGGGRVLRPFTILPSTTALSDRERLHSEVFRSSHRLPTMTIDEYLQEEQRRGNIITGGGQASYDAPTASELLELEAENDGTAGAEDAEEKKRLKEENWARFTDENKKGAGNTTNRG